MPLTQGHHLLGLLMGLNGPVNGYIFRGVNSGKIVFFSSLLERSLQGKNLLQGEANYFLLA